MKFTITLLLSLLLLCTACSDHKRISGDWECTHYALYNEYEETWRSQPEAFLNLFGMTLYEDGKAEMHVSGQENTGTFSLESDTLVLNIRDNTSKYLWKKKELQLIEHPGPYYLYENTKIIKELT
ncbi:MAG: hypothetical protein U5N56_03735 [Candidatus Marinimicrobia bacterium]|nr:hypothetical protein [Candidatus Neomarinimicrobiota bacterium]